MDNNKKVVDSAIKSSKTKSIAKDSKKIKKVLNDAGIKSSDLSGTDSQTIKSGFGFLFALATFQAKARASTYFLMLAGVVYFVFPVDVILDFIPVIGLADDVFIMALILKAVKKDYENYLGNVDSVKVTFEMYTASPDEFEVRTIDEEIDTEQLVQDLYEVMETENMSMNQLALPTQFVEYTKSQYQTKTIETFTFTDEMLSQIIYQMLINIPYDMYTIDIKKLSDFMSIIVPVSRLDIKQYIMRYKTYERSENRINSTLNLEFIEISDDEITVKAIERVECDDFSYSFLFPLDNSETILFDDHYITFMQYNLKSELNGFMLVQMLLFSKLSTQVNTTDDKIVQRFLMNNNIVEIEKPNNLFKIVSLSVNDYFYIEDLENLLETKNKITFLKEVNCE